MDDAIQLLIALGVWHVLLMYVNIALNQGATNRLGIIIVIQKQAAAKLNQVNRAPADAEGNRSQGLLQRQLHQHLLLPRQHPTPIRSLRPLFQYLFQP